MNPVLEWIACWLWSLVWWVVLLPVVWILSAPVILAAAVFQRDDYFGAVCRMYDGVTRFWVEWGTLFVP